MKTSAAQKLRLLREAHGLNQSQLAARVETSQQQIARLEDGTRKFSEDWMNRIAASMGVPPAYFLNDDPPPGAGRAGQEQNVSDTGEIRRVPLVSWVRAGDFSDPGFVPTGQEVEHWAWAGVKVGSRAFALIVKGDSMLPDFPDGMTIIVDPDRPHKDGDYVIAANRDHEATFKRLVLDDGVWQLKPDNPQYPMRPLGDRVIIGVVVQATRDLINIRRQI